MEQTEADLKMTWIQGVRGNSVVLYTQLHQESAMTPLSVFCLAKSVLSKSYLMERVAACIPNEDKKEHTQFTSNSLYYYQREEIRGKVFLIEDTDGAQEILFSIRELQIESPDFSFNLGTYYDYKRRKIYTLYNNKL